MALPTYHCLECDKDFKAGSWDCGATGQNHVIALKKYFMADAPTIVQYDAEHNRRPYIDMKSARTIVLNMPPERRVQDGDEIRIIPGGSIEFIRGRFETTNPELQFHLDRKQGLCTEERWNEVYLNDDEKMQIRQMQLDADRGRLESERNELLAQVRAMKEGAPAEAPKRRGRPPKILAEQSA